MSIPESAIDSASIATAIRCDPRHSRTRIR
jgi:hypothetical protein